MEVVSTARPPLALHCSDSLAFVRFAVQEKHRRGWSDFFKAVHLATAKKITSCIIILKLCKNELKQIDNDKTTVNAQARAKVKAKAKLND